MENNDDAFILPVTMSTQNNKFAQGFFEMLAWMEFCSENGIQTNFTINLNGATDCLRFSFDEDTQEIYKQLKENISEVYKNGGRLESFTFN